MDRSKIETIHALAREKHEQQQQQQSTTRRQLIRGAAVAGAGAISLSAATGTAAAAPSGTLPAPSDNPLLKTRVDRVRFIARTSKPADPSTGRYIVYVDDGDLP